MHLELTPARHADREFLRRLNHAAYRDVVSAQFGGWDEADQDQRFDDKWSSADYQLVLRDGEPVGALCSHDEPGCVFLAELVIDPARQNRGHGTAVLRKVIARATARGVPVELQVLRANRARALYERLGFRVYDETEIHFLMRRTSTSGGCDGESSTGRTAGQR
jgi:ribosomal protein S18 acetylase RimI-like enzyme